MFTKEDELSQGANVPSVWMVAEQGLRHCELLFRPLLELELKGEHAPLPPLGCNRNDPLPLATPVLGTLGRGL